MTDAVAPPATTRLVLFGATGDLAGRFLLPALARAIRAGELPGDLAVVGAAPQDWDDEMFAAHVARRLQEHAGTVPTEVRTAFVGRLRYRRVDLDDAATVARASHASVETGDGPVAVTALGTAGLPSGSRIAVEKPFGADLAGAIALNALLDRVSGGATDAVFRVAHALAMPGVEDLRARRSSALHGDGWDSGSVAQVDLFWEETIGLEGRADFFDRTGTVRDVVQNHLLTVLALLAEEPAAAGDLHRVRLDLLRLVRVHRPGDVASQTSRARYTAGELADGTAVPDHVGEPGVDPDRRTETWAELRSEIDQPRWA